MREYTSQMNQEMNGRSGDGRRKEGKKRGKAGDQGCVRGVVMDVMLLRFGVCPINKEVPFFSLLRISFLVFLFYYIHNLKKRYYF